VSAGKQDLKAEDYILTLMPDGFGYDGVICIWHEGLEEPYQFKWTKGGYTCTCPSYFHRGWCRVHPLLAKYGYIWNKEIANAKYERE